jgi:hypothetical protein
MHAKILNVSYNGIFFLMNFHNNSDKTNSTSARHVTNKIYHIRN